MTATDKGEPPLSSSAQLQLYIRALNDGTPHFKQSVYEVEISEDSVIGKLTFPSETVIKSKRTTVRLQLDKCVYSN